MCQLTVVSTKIPKISRIILSFQLLQNSKNSHKDGYGIMSIDEKLHYYKSGDEPLKDYDTLLSHLSSDDFKANTLIGHVRLASTINGKKILGQLKAHPFISEKFGLFHNGTLSLKTGEIPEGLTDSEYFHQRVTERITDQAKLMETVIEEYKENWEGKFAFVIPDLFSRDVYVARGNIASLYIAKLKLGDKPIGFIVNTEQYSLKENLEMCKLTIATIENRPKLSWEITELEKESYFVIKNGTNEIEKLGEFKEVEKKVDYVTTSPKVYGQGSYKGSQAIVPINIKYYRNLFDDAVTRKSVQTIKNFCNNYGFNTTDISFLILHTLEIGAKDISKTDINTFADLVIPDFEKKINRTQKKIRSLWKRIAKYLIIVEKSQLDFLFENGLKYPFFMNSRVELQTIFNLINCNIDDCSDQKSFQDLEEEDEIYDDDFEIDTTSNVLTPNIIEQNYLRSIYGGMND